GIISAPRERIGNAYLKAPCRPPLHIHLQAVVSRAARVLCQIDNAQPAERTQSTDVESAQRGIGWINQRACPVWAGTRQQLIDIALELIVQAHSPHISDLCFHRPWQFALDCEVPVPRGWYLQNWVLHAKRKWEVAFR